MSTQIKEKRDESNKNEEINLSKEVQSSIIEYGTTISTLVFLETNGNNKSIPQNLNIDKIPKDTIPKDTASTSTETDSNTVKHSIIPLTKITLSKILIFP